MKKQIYWLLSLLAILSLTACQTTKKQRNDQRLKVVTTNSILADMVKNIGKEHVDLHSIVPIGIDPHEYEPLPKDIAKASEADVLFFNGLNLETGGHGWFNKLMDTAHKKIDQDYFAASKGVDPMYLNTEGKEKEEDPHAWLDIQNGITYVKNIRNTLMKKDPKNKEIYEQNAQLYIEKLNKLDQEAKEKFADIPENKKLLVTSEGAFKYFSKAYGLQAAYIWEINTESQGTPNQMKQILAQINQTKISSLFVETSVNPQSMERVSKETNLPIYSTIFTDSIAKKGEKGDSYYGMMQWNLTQIHKGLKK